MGVDVLAKRDLIQTLKRINSDMGITLIVTSHDMDDLSDMADRLVLIHGGRLRYDGGLSGLTDGTNIEDVIADMYKKWIR